MTKLECRHVGGKTRPLFTGGDDLRERALLSTDCTNDSTSETL